MITASLKNYRIAPRKVRVVANMIRGKSSTEARNILIHASKKAKSPLQDLLESAIANAKNNFSLDTDHLYIKSITADMGRMMKRYFPRARGSAFVIRRKLSHVNLVLEERKTGKASKSRLDLFGKAKKDKVETSVDAKQESNIKPESETPKKSQIFRSDEQVKMSKAQNKRRLFNRKSGE